MEIINEWKKRPKNLKRGFKRVMAIIDNRTCHIDIKQ